MGQTAGRNSPKLLQGILVAREGPYFRLRGQDGKDYRALVRAKIYREGKVYVGDRVYYRMATPDEVVVEGVEERKSWLPHPPVANVDQVLAVTSLQDPPLDEWLLNRILLASEIFGLDAVVVLNKIDLVSREATEVFQRRYEARIGYQVILTSAQTGEGLNILQKHIEGKISVLAGASGVGKSALLNRLIPGATLRTSEVSHRTKRGRHTTTWVELLPLPQGGWIADTPGFSHMEIGMWIEPEEVQTYMRDFQRFLPCAFRDCTHTQEPGCAIREALQAGHLDPFRYRFYLEIRKELQKIREWRRKKR